MDELFDEFWKQKPNDISKSLFFLLMGIKDFLEIFMENELGRRFELNYGNILYYINTEFPLIDQFEIANLAKKNGKYITQDDVYHFLINKILEDRWFIIRFFKLDDFYVKMLEKEWG